MKNFTADSINYLVWEFETEFGVALTDGVELNFDKSFLHFNLKNTYMQKLLWLYILNVRHCLNSAKFYLNRTFLNEKNKILQNGMQLPVSWEAPASTQDTSQKVLEFLRTSLFRNTIYSQITLVRSGTIGSLKSKIKNKVLICGITNTNINRK